jgi:hypothetical protein
MDNRDRVIQSLQDQVETLQSQLASLLQDLYNSNDLDEWATHYLARVKNNEYGTHYKH